MAWKALHILALPPHCLLPLPPNQLSSRHTDSLAVPSAWNALLPALGVAGSLSSSASLVKCHLVLLQGHPAPPCLSPALLCHDIFCVARHTPASGPCWLSCAWNANLNGPHCQVCFRGLLGASLATPSRFHLPWPCSPYFRSSSLAPVPGHCAICVRRSVQLSLLEGMSLTCWFPWCLCLGTGAQYLLAQSVFVK